MPEYPSPPRNTWSRKFRVAFRGVKLGVRGQTSYFAHLFIAAAVVVASLVLKVSMSEWCVLLLCIAGVLTAEMFNSALEALARAITREHNPEIRDALDMASAAVLMAAIGSAMIGALVFVYRLGLMTGWWAG
jgi:diacylglycerol kinase